MRVFMVVVVFMVRFGLTVFLNELPVVFMQPHFTHHRGSLGRQQQHDKGENNLLEMALGARVFSRWRAQLSGGGFQGLTARLSVSQGSAGKRVAGFFQRLEELRPAVSEPWEKAARKFQALEKFPRDFPSLGKGWGRNADRRHQV
ncbi:MAG: hypothetical protein NTY53_09255 [Kiritimatiellaeota bacterium]|nr:hypothetical protein [Kiritimatiellota bacterium]